MPSVLSDFIQHVVHADGEEELSRCLGRDDILLDEENEIALRIQIEVLLRVETPLKLLVGQIVVDL